MVPVQNQVPKGDMTYVVDRASEMADYGIT